MPRFLVVLLIAVVCSAAPVAARQVTIPVRFDLAFVRQALIAQIYTEPDEKAPIFDDGQGCGWLDLYDPKVDVVQGSIHIVSRGDARIGTKVGGPCLVAFEWKGFVEVFEEPQLDAAARAVTFKIVDSNIYDEKHEKRFTTGKLWDWVKAYVHPRLEALRIDLTQPFTELHAWLPLVLPGSAERIDRLLASLVVRDPRALDGALAVTLAFDVEPRAAATAPAPEPTLSAPELAAWQARWQQWDAFLTFVVKRFAREANGELRRAVLDVLLDARYELLDALAPSRPDAPDPVPGLFLRTWERLAPVLRQSAAGLPAETTLQYTSFIAAGDALAALNEIGPDLGVEISADGLRRLARMVAPTSAEDPVAYGTAEDPELRTLLGFGAPLPPPEVSPDVDLEASWAPTQPVDWFAGPSLDTAPETTGLTRDERKGLGESNPYALSSRHLLAAYQRALLSWLLPSAFAAIEPDVVVKLNRWAPTRDDIDAYLPLVRQLLQHLGDQTVAGGDLDAQFHVVYRHLVFATAWQESCWRQFIRKGGKLTPLKSTVGSVGMMQVNQHVWRGVYNLNGLLGDIAYNGRAGGEILLHYLNDYAVAKGEHTQPGGLDNLARATYAVYNGGPGQRARYRAKKPKPSLKKIDDLFWAKYTAVRDGREMDVASCYGD